MNEIMTTASVVPGSKEMTLDDLEKVRKMVEGPTAEEKLAAWMRERGFPPEHSLLIVHEKLRAEFSAAFGPIPDYVVFHPIVEGLWLMRDPHIITRSRGAIT